MERMKIAVADDECDTREYLEEFLGYLGHEVRGASDGSSLVAVCREFEPNLIVTDYAMPGMDGWTAAKKVNQSRSVPVILVSGRHDVELLTRTREVALIRFLIKPVRAADLKEAVELVLGAVGGNVPDPRS